MDKENMTDIESLLQDAFPFWERLSLPQRDALCKGTVRTHYNKGKSVHGSGDKCTGVVILISGELRVYMLSEDGREITLYRLYGGDVCMLSASCVLDSITFDVHIDAEEDCDSLVINPAVFSSICNECIYAENFALKTAVERFSDVMWAMQQLLFMSFDQRLAAYLIEASDRTNSLDIKITHEQIAQDLNSAREVVSRMLKHFAKEGYVHLSRGKIHLINKQALASLK